MANEESVKLLTDIVASFVCHISKKLPDDVVAKLEELGRQETAPLPKVLYETMTKNQKLAVELDRPSCQDTGVLQYWVKCGTAFPLINELEALLKEATVQATFTAPLRHNSVETFDEYNTKRNVGKGTPTVWWDIVPNSDHGRRRLHPAWQGHGPDARRGLRGRYRLRSGPDDHLRPERLPPAAGWRGRGHLH